MVYVRVTPSTAPLLDSASFQRPCRPLPLGLDSFTTATRFGAHNQTEWATFVMSGCCGMLMSSLPPRRAVCST